MRVKGGVALAVDTLDRTYPSTYLLTERDTKTTGVPWLPSPAGSRRGGRAWRIARSTYSRRQWEGAAVEIELRAVACSAARMISATITARPIWNHRGLHPRHAGSGKRTAAAKVTLTQTRTMVGRDQAAVAAVRSTRGGRRIGSRAPSRAVALGAARPGGKGSIRWISMRTTATSHLGAAVGRAGRFGCR